MTAIAFTILVVLVLLVILIYMTLAKIPGDKARERGHPQAEAINVLGWIGLLLGLAPWVVALVWAHMKPVVPTLDEGTDDA
jgi:multisubunit Na+/H+ antiporter MnhB subunit